MENSLKYTGLIGLIVLSLISCERNNREETQKMRQSLLNDRYHGEWYSENSFEFDSIDNLGRKVHLVTPKRLILERESESIYNINWGGTSAISVEGIGGDEILRGMQFILEEVDGKLFLHVGEPGDVKAANFYWERLSR